MTRFALKWPNFSVEDLQLVSRDELGVLLPVNVVLKVLWFRLAYLDLVCLLEV